MKLIVAHAKCMILELLRQPAYVVSSIAFPALFYIIFAVPESKDVASSNFLLASFSGFAVFGVVFLQFGVGIAQDRTRSWHYFLQTLPHQPLQLLAARFLSALFVALLAAGGIVVLAISLTEAQLSVFQWSRFFTTLIMPSLVFCIMGLALGYWTSEKSSLPIGNLIYLPLSFAGGLWKPPEILPQALKKVSEVLPTRHYGELLWASVKKTNFSSENFSWLAAYAVLFALLAYVGFRLDSQRRFG